MAIPDRRVRHLPVTTPFAALPPCGVRARLACLIHAANVHSEPGSNPSKMSRYPTRSLSKFERFHEEPDPQSQGLRNKKWSMRAIPPPRNLGTAQTEAAGINRSHAGFPQGSITRRISNLSRLVSYLADECNRPNCQRRITTEVRTHQRRNEPSLLGTTAEGDCRVLFYRRHRPVQGCGMPARPGRHLAWV